MSDLTDKTMRCFYEADHSLIARGPVSAYTPGMIRADVCLSMSMTERVRRHYL